MDVDKYKSELRASIEETQRRKEDAAKAASDHAKKVLGDFFALAEATNDVVPGAVKIETGRANEFGSYECGLRVGSRFITFLTSPTSSSVTIGGMSEEIKKVIPDENRGSFVSNMQAALRDPSVKLSDLEKVKRAFADLLKEEVPKLDLS